MKGYLKKLLVTSFIVTLAISVVSCGDNRNTRAKVTPAAGTPAPEVSSSPDSIAVNGTLAPARQIKLGFQVSGQVKEIAEIGDMVVAGQVVARLDDTRLKWSVEEARVKLKQAELELEKAQKPADPDELAAAEKAIQAAQTVLDNAHGSVPTTTDLAQNALRTAQLVYDRAERDHKHLLDMKGWGYDVEDELKSSQLQLDNARTDLDIARRNASGASVRASESVALAQSALAEAQARYAALKSSPTQTTSRPRNCRLKRPGWPCKKLRPTWRKLVDGALHRHGDGADDSPGRSGHRWSARVRTGRHNSLASGDEQPE